jgi:hypothetical protein
VRLPVSMGSGMSVSFLMKNHIFHHSTGGHQEVKSGINSRPKSDKEVHTAQHHCFCI